jgi:YD repeat-containing protein
MDVGVDRNMNVNLDYNAEGRLIGIEVLGAAEQIDT